MCACCSTIILWLAVGVEEIHQAPETTKFVINYFFINSASFCRDIITLRTKGSKSLRTPKSSYCSTRLVHINSNNSCQSLYIQHLETAFALEQQSWWHSRAILADSSSVWQNDFVKEVQPVHIQFILKLFVNSSDWEQTIATLPLVERHWRECLHEHTNHLKFANSLSYSPCMYVQI